MLTSATMPAIRRLALRAGLLSGLAAATACPGFPAAAAETAAAPAAATVVRIDNFAFAPATLTVPVGTTVTWVNDDDAPHAVAEKDRRFKSKPLDTDDEFTYTFSSPGSFEYFCTLHPHMVGTIVVRPGGPLS
jgi:plastocyanin